MIDVPPRMNELDGLFDDGLPTIVKRLTSQQPTPTQTLRYLV